MDLILSAHPDPSSLNAQLVSTLTDALQKRNREIKKYSLYEEKLDPLLSLEEIQRGVSWDPLVESMKKDLQICSSLYIFYPDWWGQPPAILKGWMDRVLAPETAYRWVGGEWEDKHWTPLLEGKEAHIIVTADQEADRDFLRKLWDERSLGKCGMKVSLHVLDRLHSLEYSDIQDQFYNAVCR